LHLISVPNQNNELQHDEEPCRAVATAAVYNEPYTSLAMFKQLKFSSETDPFSRAHPASYPMGIKGSLPGGEAAGA
jgi:hypothetical protein